MVVCGLALPVVLAASGVYLAQRPTRVVLNAPYSLVEWRVFSTLGLDRGELVARRHAQSHARGQAKAILTMDTHTHRLVAYEPDAHIHFWGDHRYNIMATGGERLEVDVRRIAPGQTEVTLDYAETTRLFGLIPVTWRLGRSQERRLARVMFEL